MNLITTPHTTLNMIASPVEEGIFVDSTLIIMWEELTKHKGIGLATNQINHLERIIIMQCNGLKLELINPVITKRYGGKITSKEGCLSFPGIEVTIVRDKQIIVEGFNRNWKPIRRKLKGLTACCIQHEIDHLNGKCIA